MAVPVFILASASPARRQLLEAAGIVPVVCPSDFDESQIEIENAVELAQTLAQLKAETVAEQIRLDDRPPRSFRGGEPPESVVIAGCDSVLQVDDAIYGKPDSPQAAIERWQHMRGRVGLLHTGHALIDIAQDLTVARTQTTRVHFADASDRQIEAYVATGEPLRCAGCFALDGMGGLLVEKIEGCHSNVIGLSLPLLRQMLEELGYDPSDFWQREAVG
jgi:septum formation protein